MRRTARKSRRPADQRGKGVIGHDRADSRTGYRVKFSPFMATVEAAEFVKKLRQLQPNNDSQRTLQAQLLSAIANLSQARLSLFTQSNDSIPAPFLVILILWLAVIFTSFGLFVRPNRIAIVTF